MRIAASVGAVVALAGAPIGAAERGPKPAPKDAQALIDELIVKFKPGLNQGERERAITEAGGAFDRKLRRHAALLARVNPALLDLVLKKLRSHPRVEYAEPNYRVHASAVTPNDPSFGQLWGLKNTGQAVNGTGGTADADIDADEAWDVTTGSSSVVVGVIDTGVDFTHPDLGSSATAANPVMWTNPGELGSGKDTNGLDDDGNGFVDDWRGWDFVNNDNNPFDDESHGTHVSGTIGARGNDGVGVTGVNWNVKIMALKFLDASGSGDIADAAEALEYATAMGADVTNNSWGGGGFSNAMFEAIEDADAGGSLFVAASGNESSDSDVVPSYPASYDLPNVISVSASTQTDGRASFANIGRRSVDLAAPGTNVYSTIPGGGYDWWNGTSMATPHVSGAAALAKAAFPAASDVGIKALLLRTVDPAAAFANLTRTEGRLNVGSALGCTDELMLWVEQPLAGFKVGVGEGVPISVISTNCGQPAGATATADVNGTPVVLTNHGDGLFTGTYAPTGTGPLTVTVTGTVSGLTETRTISGSAEKNYRFVDDTYAWITPSGTQVTLGDDQMKSYNLPFTFTFYAQTFTSVGISSNGFLVLRTTTAGTEPGGTEPENAPIPTGGAPNRIVAPYWDDLHPGRSGAAVWRRTVGSAPNRKFVVSWVNVPHYFDTGNRVTFQVILEEATKEIVFQYADTFFDDPAYDHGASATVGNENSDGTLGRQFSSEQASLQTYQAAKSIRAKFGDVTPPQTSIDSGPSGTTNATNASFGFSSSETGSTFDCKLEVGTWAGCTPPPKNYSALSEGPHTFQVRATDPAGNVDATPAERTWTIDTTPPETTIDSGPSGSTNSTNATFTFSSEPGATFECRRDGGLWSACSLSQTYTGLADGSYTFEVRATDDAGNVDSSPAEQSWTVDTVAPETTIDSGPSGTTTSAGATFTFSSSEVGSTFECSLDGGGWSICTSSKSYDGLGIGTHTFRVRATDPSGNVDATAAERSWTIESSNLLSNGSFEGSLAGWSGWRASLALTSNGVVGTAAARVVPRAGEVQYAITTWPRVSSIAGTRYSASAWVRSDAPGKGVCLFFKEWNGANFVAQVKRCVTATAGWQQIPAIAHTSSGGTLELMIHQGGAAGTDSFETDGVTLTETTDAGA